MFVFGGGVVVLLCILRSLALTAPSFLCPRIRSTAWCEFMQSPLPNLSYTSLCGVLCVVAVVVVVTVVTVVVAAAAAVAVAVFVARMSITLQALS